jgi:hypothetical protein
MNSIKSRYAIVTAANDTYFFALISLLESLIRSGNESLDCKIFDLGLKNWQRDWIEKFTPLNVICLNLPKLENMFKGWDEPTSLNHYAWKPVAIGQFRTEYEGIFWIDAGVLVTRNLSEYISLVSEEGALLIKNYNHRNRDWTSQTCIERMKISNMELDSFQIMGNFFSISFSNRKGLSLFEEWFYWCRIEEVVKGDRKTHRHDQTVLSILASRFQYTLQPESNFTLIGRFRSDYFAAMKNQFVFVSHRRWIILLPTKLLSNQGLARINYLFRALKEFLRVVQLQFNFKARQTRFGKIYVKARDQIRIFKNRNVVSEAGEL